MLPMLLAALVAAPTPPPAATSARFPPFEHFEPLPGRVIGILVGDPEAELQVEGRFGPQGEVCFAAGEASYRWIYSERGGAGNFDITDLRISLLGGGTRIYPRLRVSNAASVGVDGAYHLVEATVNGGAGSPADEHFVISDVNVLDGSAEHPIVVERVVADATKRLAAFDDDQADDVLAALRKAGAAFGMEKGPIRIPAPAVVPYVTWLEGNASPLEVRFQQRWTASGFGLEQASLYRFDAKGRLTSQSHEPLLTWVAPPAPPPPPWAGHPISDPPFPPRDGR